MGTAAPYRNTRGSRVEVRLVNTHNAIDMYYRVGSDWKKIEPSYDLSGYETNTFGGFDSLRPALTASGTGQVKFTHFSYAPFTPGQASLGTTAGSYAQ